MSEFVDRVFPAIARERELRESLATYLRNVRLRRVERDDDYEQELRDAIAAAELDVDATIEDIRSKWPAQRVAA